MLSLYVCVMFFLIISLAAVNNKVLQHMLTQMLPAYVCCMLYCSVFFVQSGVSLSIWACQSSPPNQLFDDSAL